MIDAVQKWHIAVLASHNGAVTNHSVSLCFYQDYGPKVRVLMRGIIGLIGARRIYGLGRRHFLSGRTEASKIVIHYMLRKIYIRI